MKTRILLVLVFLVLPLAVSAEIVYLKDGQVVNGAIINEDAATITIKTKYETKKIARSRIKRILFGERQMEKQYILMKNGDLIEGYLVDQDAKKVILRDQENSKKERTILKSDISQMSRDRIRPLFPDLTVRVGFYYPFDTGGSKTSYSAYYGIGSAINFPWVSEMRVYFEGGFILSPSTSSVPPYNEVSLMMIPVTASFTYRIPISFLEVVPKLGGGFSVTIFDNGQGETFTGTDGLIIGGVGAVFPIVSRTFYLSIWAEYFLFIENSTMIHSTILSGSVAYRF